MKCPKCGYLGFESVDRCRNCGYDFSLTLTSGHLELPLKVTSADPEARHPLDDLSCLDAALPPESLGPSGVGTPGVPRAATLAPAQGSISTDLPLFGAAIPDDVPLITKPSPPRPPLAVRRATPEVPRLRGVSTREAMLDLGLEPPPDDEAPGDDTRSTEVIADHAGDEVEEDAAIGARFAAFVTDAMILAAIDAAVVYFTMQICGIGVQDLGILPRAPLVAFLLVQNGGYLVAFTAGGQTLGKMAAGIKVVPAEPRSSLDLGRAFVRELVWLALAAPAGLGLLTVLSRDHRGVHDRFAGTRVVRA